MKQLEKITVEITKTKHETPYMVEIYINDDWYKEMGPFIDPQLALQEVSKNEDLQEFMKPKSFRRNERRN